MYQLRQSICVIALCLLSLSVFAQRPENFKESFINRDDEDKELFFEILNNEKEFSYLTLGHGYNPEDLTTPISSAEGKNILAEGYVAPSYYVIKPYNKRTGNHRNFALSFQGLFNMRLINTSSSPSLPPTNAAGLKLDILEHTGKVSHGYFTFEAMHYSNGGSPGAIDSLTLGTKNYLRNDYTGGDFSTNYLRAGNTQLLNARLFNQFNYLALYAYFQYDLSLFTPLEFLDIQKDRYGQQRLGGRFTFSTTMGRNNGSHLIIRYEPKVILDKAVILDHPNTQYEWSHKLQVVASAPNISDTGLFAQFYWGRDYMNIRYDIPVFYWSVGFAFDVTPEFDKLKKAK